MAIHSNIWFLNQNHSLRNTYIKVKKCLYFLILCFISLLFLNIAIAVTLHFLLLFLDKN